MTLADIHVNWLNWFHFLIFVIKMFMSTFFPRTARHWNSLPVERSLLINSSFSVCFNLSVLLFPVTAYLVVAVQPGMEWISLKEVRIREKYTAKTYVTIIICRYSLLKGIPWGKEVIEKFTLKIVLFFWSIVLHTFQKIVVMNCI